ncbi:MAG: dehydrogenase E1 component subunit alpha/beta [Bacteriovoracaceae bacterium]
MSKANDKKLEIIKKYKLSKSDLVWFLRNIYLSRKTDDAEMLMKKQNTAFFQISGAGHEGVLTAISKVLKPTYDYFLCYYRDRALCLGLGVSVYEMLCQANGNTGDTSSHGRQMPAHFGNKKLNIISKSACTGTQYLQACGVAEAGNYLGSLKKNSNVENSNLPKFNKDEIMYVSSGEGATSEGEFWESITTAVIHKLPVFYVIQDNGFAISCSVELQTPEGSISKTLENFPGLKVIYCDGTCPIESYAAAKEAEAYLRARKGPVLLHAKCTRPYSHSLSDDQAFYRSADELSEEAKIDVVNTYPKFLIDNKIITAKENEELQTETHNHTREAMKKAVETPMPAKSTCMDHLYSNIIDPRSENFESTPNTSGKADVPMAAAINGVLKSEVKKNPLIRIFGQDVADFSDEEKLKSDLKGKGGVFKITSGVQRIGLKDQVFNAPLAEANIIGRAIGMSIRGLRPVVEIQFFDYIWPAYMQLKNEMTTLRYRSGGDYKCPMVVRVPIGGYLKGGSIYHSQCGESLFTHLPGVYVVFPSNAQDAAGLLRTAINCDDPVMFLEHKHLYYQGYNRCADPGENYTIPFGKARIVKQGKDLTVVCYGALVQKCVEAAKLIEERMGKTVEIIDPRTLVPFDIEAVKKSLSKTNRLLIAHEEVKTSGFAGEIAALINEECFEYLDAPILRVTAKDVHVAYCPDLEEVILPQINDVYLMMEKLLNY